MIDENQMYMWEIYHIDWYDVTGRCNTGDEQWFIDGEFTSQEQAERILEELRDIVKLHNAHQEDLQNTKETNLMLRLDEERKKNIELTKLHSKLVIDNHKLKQTHEELKKKHKSLTNTQKLMKNNITGIVKNELQKIANQYDGVAKI